MSAFLAAHPLQDTAVAMAANYRARGVLERLPPHPSDASGCHRIVVRVRPA